MANERLAVGLDFDGVMIKKAKSYDLVRRATKMGLPPLPGVLEALEQMRHRFDLSIAGVYTVRPSWLRGTQTRNQIRRNDFGVERVVHTNNNPREKVRMFLLDTVGANPDVERAILVDDSYGKIKEAIDELTEEREMHPLLDKLAFFVFGKVQGKVNTGKHFDRVMPFISPPGIHMKWAPGNFRLGGVAYAIPIIALSSWNDLSYAMGKLQYFHENHPFKSTA